MAAYLTLAEFKARTQMPASDVDSLEAGAAGWILQQLVDESAWIDSRLSKRYAAPFVAPIPNAVLRWLTRIVTDACYIKRGVDANDLQIKRIESMADEARKEIAEAADSEKGLFDLPLRQDTSSSGISKGAPMGSSETSPYVFMDRQARIGRDEDSRGEGTSDA